MRPLPLVAYLSLAASMVSSSCGGTVAPSGDAGSANASSGSTSSSSGSGSGGSSSGGTGSSSGVGTGSSSSGGSTGTSSSSSGGMGSGSSSGGVPGDAGAACPTVVLQAPQSVQDIVTAVQGRWMVCEYLSSLFPYWAPTDTVGMEFTAAATGAGSCGSDPGCMGGLVYFLVQGSSGLTRGNGNGYQIWYSIDTSLELVLAQAPNNGTWSTSVSVSSSPREFWIEQLSYMNGPRLVAAQ